VDQLISYFDQCRGFASHHLNPEAFTAAAAVAGAAVVAGVLISVIGAKLAKTAFTVVMTLVGVGASSSLAYLIPDAPWVAYLLGAVAGAVLGFLLFRLWVGGVAAGVFAVAAMAYAGHAQFLPALDRIDGSALAVGQDGSAAFAVPTPTEQQAFQKMSVGELTDRFWNEIKLQDPAAPGRLRNFGIVAGVVGLGIGLLLSRLTLIVCTSLVGTGLLVCGLFYLGQAFWPEVIEQLSPHGRYLALVAASFFVFSAVLQSRLTHKAKNAGAAAPPKAIPV